MKSVQGDSGHAQVKMVADVYSHIIDEDRCINAQRLEEAFYSSKTPDPVAVTSPKNAARESSRYFCRSFCESFCQLAK